MRARRTERADMTGPFDDYAGRSLARVTVQSKRRATQEFRSLNIRDRLSAIIGIPIRDQFFAQSIEYCPDFFGQIIR